MFIIVYILFLVKIFNSRIILLKELMCLIIEINNLLLLLKYFNVSFTSFIIIILQNLFLILWFWCGLLQLVFLYVYFNDIVSPTQGQNTLLKTIRHGIDYWTVEKYLSIFLQTIIIACRKIVLHQKASLHLGDYAH